MNHLKTLQQAITQFESIFYYCTPKKYRNKQGYDYLICANKTEAKGSIHVNNYFDYKTFGYYENNNARLSTQAELKLNDIIFYNNYTFAIKQKLLFNENMGLNHYELISASDFFKDFIITDNEIKNEIIGNNSTRFILNLNHDIALIPSKLEPQNSTKKFISFEIIETKAQSMPSVINENNNTYLSQAKSDLIQFNAINLNTKELQDFIHVITNNTDFGYYGMPCFKQNNDDFNQGFNIKANIQEMLININYCINTSFEIKEQLINEINLNLLNLT